MEIKEVYIEWNKEMPIYTIREYASLLGNHPGWLGGYAEGKLLYVLPYTICNTLIFKYIKLLFNAICLDINSNLDIEKEFLNEVIKYLRDKKIDFIVQTPNYSLFKTTPEGADFITYGTYVINLQDDEDAIFAKMKKDKRKKIRHGMATCKILSGIEYKDIAYELIIDSLGRSGMKFMTITQYHKYLECFGSNIGIYVSYYEEKPQGCIVVPYSSYCAFVEHGGSINNPVTGSMDYLHWYAITELKNKGIKLYDFVGVRVNPIPDSKQDGIARYKRQFGGELISGYIWRYIYSKWKYKLYNFLVRIKHHKKVIDIIDSEIASNCESQTN
jgi:hypothetical protein